MLQTVSSNLAQLQTPGALGSDDCLVAPVVQDAMTLANDIGYQCLWVDALCIVQDSPDKGQQLQAMDNIYMRAELTIIAMTCEDANSRLPGVVLGTPVHQPVAVVEGQILSADIPSLMDEKRTSRHFTRAWTYQEMMLSPRCLSVSPYQIHLQCRSYNYTECFPYSIILPSFSDLSAWRDNLMGGYEEYVEAYTSRMLTYDYDIINAFTGILQLLSATCHVEFYAAMPIADSISRALRWVSTSTCPPRRSYAGSPGANSNCYLSSWSWAGWKGPVWYPGTNSYILCTVSGLLSSASMLIRDASNNDSRDMGITLTEDPIESEYCWNGCFVSLGSDATLGNTESDASNGSRPLRQVERGQERN
ncbi:hypothetical protein BBP40_006330 [Aspergillus hancockii]|nr:hypothetical protein BBP40_006330 [Aspergillus hancockii]